MTDNPLTETHAGILDNVLDSAQRARELIQKCRECNIPMDDLHAENEAQHLLASNLKRKFFPGRV